MSKKQTYWQKSIPDVHRMWKRRFTISNNSPYAATDTMKQITLAL